MKKLIFSVIVASLAMLPALGGDDACKDKAACCAEKAKTACCEQGKTTKSTAAKADKKVAKKASKKASKKAEKQSAKADK
jgi:hypothetical protein